MARRILLLIGFVVPVLEAEEIEFLTRELSWAVVERAYAPDPLQVRTNGKCPSGGVGFEIVGGTLPAGVSLSRSGYFSGTPRHMGAYPIRIRASNGCSWTAKLFSLTVAAEPVLSVVPAQLELRWPEPGVLRVTSSWPRLAYHLETSGGCVKATPGRGVTEDTIGIEAMGERCSAVIKISAWQAQTVFARVDVLVEPGAAR